MNRIKIPDTEYKERVKKASELVREKALDLFFVNSTEADFANVRYFSGFWPLFERAGVVIAATGEAALIVGPESLQFATDVSRIDKIFQLMEYRESADPSYPEVKPDSFKEVIKSLGLSNNNFKIGIGGYLDTTLPMMDVLVSSFPDARITRTDDIMVSLRSIKSANEINCLKEAFRITEIALAEVLKNIKPGMTELQVVGIAQKVIYDNGAEYEGLPMNVFTEKATRHAISRPSHNILKKGDIVQLNISARVDGYSVCIGIPVSMGKLTGRKKEIVEFGLMAHNWTKSQLKAGRIASDIAGNYVKLFKDNGFGDNYLYGPCHGMGMIEVEAPWMETNSNYILEPNMVFQIDTFVSTKEFGVRWEKGIAVKQDGCEELSDWDFDIYEID